MISQQTCKARKDFLRHIVNPHISEALLAVDNGNAVNNIKGDEAKEVNQKIISVLTEIKTQLGAAEAKSDFSIYGGNPLILTEYLRGAQWKGLLTSAFEELKTYPEAWNFVESVIRQIMMDLSDSYRDSCAEVSKAAEEVLTWLSTLKASQATQGQEGQGMNQS